MPPGCLLELSNKKLFHCSKEKMGVNLSNRVYLIDISPIPLHDPSGMALPSARFQLIVGLGFPNAAHDSFKWSPSKTIIA